MFNDNSKVYITDKGRENIIERIASLERRLSGIRSHKGDAAENGGNAWHDNAEFEGLEHQERMLMAEISALKSKLSKAGDVAVTSKIHSSVEIGSAVKIKYIGSGEERDIEIVGFGEGDPAVGKITYDSPLGQCITGASIGDERELKLNSVTQIVKIIDVR